MLLWKSDSFFLTWKQIPFYPYLNNPIENKALEDISKGQRGVPWFDYHPNLELGGKPDSQPIYKNKYEKENTSFHEQFLLYEKFLFWIGFQERTWSMMERSRTTGQFISMKLNYRKMVSLRIFFLSFWINLTSEEKGELSLWHL